MIEEHSFLRRPDNLDQKIWRYVDFTKFIDLLDSESLYFCRADKLEDVFEGSIPSPTIERRGITTQRLIQDKKLSPKYTSEYFGQQAVEVRKDIVLNCWSMNDHESAAMWKIYLKSNEGIAIQTTFSKLKLALRHTDHRIMMSAIKYIDYQSDNIEWDHVLLPFIHKRKSYAHENELRVFMWSAMQTKTELQTFSESGIKIKVDLRNLIEKVHVAPNAPAWLTSLTKNVCKKFNFQFEVINSHLDSTPIF